MTIQWFPGHMQKARRQMEEQLKLVDIIIELKDARIPLASSNPIIKELAPNKPRLVILNKSDLADAFQNNEWMNYYENCLLIDSLNSNITKNVVNKIKDILKDKLKKAQERGIRKKVLRAMVVGIPNVGKSTFINNVVKRNINKVEDRPGVTKSLNWIKINEDVELLDTPGILWPKFENQDDAKLLTIVGSINDDVINDKYEVVKFGLDYLKENYPNVLNSRYGVNTESDDLLDDICINKNFVGKNNENDIDKCIDFLLKDFRTGKIGKVTWQKC